MRFRSRLLTLLLLLCWPLPGLAQTLTLPLRKGSVRFGVIGDTGTGDRSQDETAKQFALYRQKFPFTFTLMLGDNIYGSERPQDYDRKFVKPYKALLDANVEFHAALGNHDDPNQRFYKPFNLGGERYRTFKKGNVRFYVLDSNYMDPDQVKWLIKELQGERTSAWKIAYLHHPLYTTARRGAQVELRQILEPIFIKYGVDVVYQGHEHIYERIRPQHGVYYFTVGGGAKLRSGDVRVGALTESGFATDRSFMLVEVAGNELHFQVISRKGETVDKGVIRRRAVRQPIVASTPPKAKAAVTKPKPSPPPPPSRKRSGR